MMEKNRNTIDAMWLAANDKMQSAKLLLAAGQFNDRLSRAYYAAFHAISLLFFVYGKSFSKHSTLIGNFNKEFIFGVIVNAGLTLQPERFKL